MSGISDIDSVQNYLDKFLLKFEFIKSNYPDLENDKIVLLATYLNKFAGQDLKNRVEQYLAFGKLKRHHLDFLYNTCDPDNGYWHDKLLNPFSVKRYGRIAGFRSKLARPIKRSNKLGFPRILKRYLKNTVNSILPLPVIYFYTPQFIVICRKEKK